MKEFIEKLIGRLEERIKLHNKKAQGYANKALPTLAIDTLAKREEVKEIMNIVNELAEEYESKTQADRIRSMDDEELAEFIDKVSGTCLVDALGGKSECNTECRVCKIKFGSILDWLQSEVE